MLKNLNFLLDLKLKKKKNKIQIINYSKKIVNLSEEELKKHKSFLKAELKKNYY